MFSYNFIILFVPAIIDCFPVNLDVKSDVRDETTFPNGTVIGKYSYVDNDGTPVQVKYFADDKNYGVELQSIKVVEGNELSAPSVNTAKTDYLASDPSTMLLEPVVHGNTGFDFPTVYPKPEDKYKIPNPMDFLNMKSTPKNYCKQDKPLNYDLTQNNLMPLKDKKCGKDKVRIYNDKRNRRVRKNVDIYKDEMPKICDRF